MKYIMIIMLLIMTSFSNVYASLSHKSMTTESIKMMSMDSDCHMNMDSLKMESMNCDDSLMTEDCSDCNNCVTHCMSSSVSILNTFSPLSLKPNDNSFNSYLKSLRITKQISNLFRPPIA